MHGRPTQPALRFPLAYLAVVCLCGLVDAAFYSSQSKAELRNLAHETWNHAYNSYKRQSGLFSVEISGTDSVLLRRRRRFPRRRAASALVCSTGSRPKEPR